MKKVRILTLDGGGIRGIIPAVILNYIEKRIQEKTENPNAKISDYFDMIAGTSTGGILSVLLSLPAENDKKNGRYFAKEAIELYKTHGKEIFKKKRITKVFGALYTAKGLDNILKEKMGDIKLSESRKNCLITAYDISNREAVFFSSTDAVDSKDDDYYMREIARATSAAPTYFTPAKVQSLSGRTDYLIDGGVFANDPTMSALVEARKNKFSNIENPNFKEMYVVSIGTGKDTKRYTYEKAKKWGIAQWAVPILKILMSSSAEVVSYQVRKLFESLNCSDSYERLEPDLCKASNEMDDVSDKNIFNLENAGLIFVKKNKELLNKIADELIKNE